MTGTPRDRKSARAWAWLAFLLGIAASVAANVAHARPEIGPRLSAAFVPVALIVVLEVAARLKRDSSWRWTGTVIVALVAAVVSYRHQRELLIGYGEDSLNATIMPFAVDGLMITAAWFLLSRDKTGDSVRPAAPAKAPAKPPVTATEIPATLPPREPRDSFAADPPPSGGLRLVRPAAPGARNGKQLTEAEREEIRLAYSSGTADGTWNLKAVAAQYGVDPKTVTRTTKAVRDQIAADKANQGPSS